MLRTSPQPLAMLPVLDSALAANPSPCSLPSPAPARHRYPRSLYTSPVRSSPGARRSRSADRQPRRRGRKRNPVRAKPNRLARCGRRARDLRPLTVTDTKWVSQASQDTPPSLASCASTVILTPNSGRNVPKRRRRRRRRRPVVVADSAGHASYGSWTDSTSERTACDMSFGSGTHRMSSLDSLSPLSARPPTPVPYTPTRRRRTGSLSVLNSPIVEVHPRPLRRTRSKSASSIFRPSVGGSLPPRAVRAKDRSSSPRTRVTLLLPRFRSVAVGFEEAAAAALTAQGSESEEALTDQLESPVPMCSPCGTPPLSPLATDDDTSSRGDDIDQPPSPSRQRTVEAPWTLLARATTVRRAPVTQDAATQCDVTQLQPEVDTCTAPSEVADPDTEAVLSTEDNDDDDGKDTIQDFADTPHSSLAVSPVTSPLWLSQQLSEDVEDLTDMARPLSFPPLPSFRQQNQQSPQKDSCVPLEVKDNAECCEPVSSASPTTVHAMLHSMDEHGLSDAPAVTPEQSSNVQQHQVHPDKCCVIL